MSLVLYRKYRPQVFSEVVGQDHIIGSLKGGLTSGKFSHAYLFTGPRGTGKTTVARILAKAFNCENLANGEPCGKCGSCLIVAKGEAMDIMEIDAASNRGIDEIRALRDGIRFVPASLKYKIFIIDEVHMLTKESFNALLKTVEEPPAHALFILATTEIHKVPLTIISRCQRFDFQRLETDKLTARLKKIAKAEKAKISEEALRFIGLASDGCMRDAESLLGQIIASGDKKIELEDVQKILAVADSKTIFDFFGVIFSGDRYASFLIINDLVDRGIDTQHFMQDAISHLRKLVFMAVCSSGKTDSVFCDNVLNAEKVGKEARFFDEWTDTQKKMAYSQAIGLKTENFIGILNIFVKAMDDLRKFPLPQMALELAALEAIEELEGNFLADDSKTVADKAMPLEEKGQSIKNNRINAVDKENKINANKDVSSNEAALEIKEKTLHSELTIDSIKNHWDDVLKEVKPHNNSLFAFVGASLPRELENNILIVAVKYNFHKERLEETKNRLIIEGAIEKVFNKKMKLKFILDQNLTLSQRISEGAKDLVSSALKIFGGKIVE